MAARQWGDRDALVFEQRRYSFRAIAAEVDRVAKGLITLGIEPGDNVAIWLVNCPEWIVAMFAIARIGAVHVPVNTRFRTDDVEYVLRQSNATTLITHDVSGPVDYLAMVRELVPELGQAATAQGVVLRPALASNRFAGGAADDGTLEARARAVRPDGFPSR